MPSISVFDQTSTLLLECLVPVLKPFLTDPNSKFIEKLKAEADVEINYENEEGNDVVTFSGDFTSILRANEITSDFFKQLSEHPDSQLQVPINTNDVDSDLTETLGLEQNMLMSVALQIDEQTIPMTNLTENQMKTEKQVIKDNINDQQTYLDTNNDLDTNLSSSGKTTKNISETLTECHIDSFPGSVKHNYKLRKAKPKFSVKSLMKYENDSDLDINKKEQLSASMASSDEEYVPAADEYDKDLERPMNRISCSPSTTVNTREDNACSSKTLPQEAVSDEVNTSQGSSDDVEIVSILKVEIGSISKDGESGQVMARGKCKFCAYHNFLKYNNSKKELKNHYKRQHVKRELVYTCVICSKKFATKRDLHIHKQLHERKTCDICGKSIVRRQFSIHAKRHAAGFVANTHECDICKRKYPSGHRLKIHKATQHSDQRQMFPCNICKRLLSTNDSLDNHVKNVHKINQDSFTCEICGKYFTSSRSYNYHKLTHDTSHERPQYLCSICNKVFISKGGLKFHLRSHDGKKDYLCSYCGKSFNCSNSLQRHILTHTGEKPFGCKQCSSKFNDVSILRRHMILVHKRTAKNWKN